MSAPGRRVRLRSWRASPSASICARLIGRRLAPEISQSGDRSRTGALSKAGSRTLRWAAVEAAHQSWRPTNPWHELYGDIARRAGKNPAKWAVARKVVIVAGHVLSREQPFAPARRHTTDSTPVSASSAASWPPDGPAWN